MENESKNIEESKELNIPLKPHYIYTLLCVVILWV
jgi:hypothetical protein